MINVAADLLHHEFSGVPIMLSFFVRPPNLPADVMVRLQRVERKLDLILGRLGVVYDDAADEFPERSRSLADQGDKIGAIREYRNATGAGLAEAKQAVEAYLKR